MWHGKISSYEKLPHHFINKEHSESIIHNESVSVDSISNSKTIKNKVTHNTSLQEKNKLKKAKLQNNNYFKRKNTRCKSNSTTSNIQTEINKEKEKLDQQYNNKNYKEIKKLKTSLNYDSLNSFLEDNFPEFNSLTSIVISQSGSRNFQQLLHRIEDWLVEEIYYSVSQVKFFNNFHFSII